MKPNRVLAALLATVAAFPVSGGALMFAFNLTAIICAMILWSKE